MHVAGYADDSEPFMGQVRVQLLAEGFLIGPVAIHEGFADDHDALRSFHVLLARNRGPSRGELQGVWR